MADKFLEQDGLRIRELPGWKTFKQAGEVMGVSRQWVHTMVFTDHLFDESDLAFVGLSHQPLHLIRDEAVQAEAARRRSGASRVAHPNG